MKVFHHNDLDGRCSAAIVHAWVGIKSYHREIKADKFATIRTVAEVPEVSFVEMDYANPFPFDTIQKNEQVWIVDFSLKAPDMLKLLDITQDITWIDHHVTAIENLKDITDKFNIAGYRRTDRAGCVLTWEYVHWYSQRGSNGVTVTVESKCQPMGVDKLIPVARAVSMIGDYDAWLHKIPDSTAFYEGCKMIPALVSPESIEWFDLMCDGADGQTGDGKPLPKKNVCVPIINNGKAAIKYRDCYCEDMCNSYGFETVFDGFRIWVTNIYKFGSMGFGERMKQYDACAACVFDGRKWTISLYSDKPEIHVGNICRRHGGGGHKGAAGFVCNEFPFKR